MLQLIASLANQSKAPVNAVRLILTLLLVALLINLNVDDTTLPPLEVETRRRTWWFLISMLKLPFVFLDI
jgi:hypothetical protein